MAITIFYSWQSDLPNNTNRGLIGTALENVAKLREGKVEEAERPLEIDSATKGVPGAVNIVKQF